MDLSVIIPVYNERNTVETLVERVFAVDLPLKQVVIVDDASTDGTAEVLDKLAERFLRCEILRHDVNQGKGAAIRSGLRASNGDIVAIQDADLEYIPSELARLIEPILSGDADVVFGSRFSGSGPHRVVYFWHMVGNRFLTLLSNMFTNLNLSDMECCYKLFRREVIQDIQIEENRFGFEPEITAKIAGRDLRIYEVGISYYGRTYAEGKKINWKDGLRAIVCILKYNLFRRAPPKRSQSEQAQKTEGA